MTVEEESKESKEVEEETYKNFALEEEAAEEIVKVNFVRD